MKITNLKGIGKEFQQLVIRRYLETSIQKKLFLQFIVITNKDYFSTKKAQFAKFIVAVYWFISTVVTSLIGAIHGAIGNNCNIVSNIVFIS